MKSEKVKVNNGWEQTTLGEILKVDELTVDSSYPFDEIEYIDIASVEERKILQTQKLKLRDAPSRAKRIVRDNDILISTVRPNLKHYCFIKKAAENLIASTGFAVITAKKADPAYLYYLLTTDEYTAYLSQIAEGHTSAYPSFNPEVIENSVFVMPPLPEQKAIAAVLSSFDDKIELLRRQNKTLEKIAETLFRKWFIEDANPKWKDMSLLDAITLVGGGTPKTDITEYWDGNIKWISAKDITGNHRGFIIDTEKKITSAGLNNSSTKLLPAFSTVISARGTVGKYCLLAENMAFSQSNYGILPKIKNCFFFTYLLIAHIVDDLQKAAYGCVFDTITTSTFKEQIINIPSEKYVCEFEKEISLYFKKIHNNTLQIQTLSKLRDTLLTKLIKGEIRVR